MTWEAWASPEMQPFVVTAIMHEPIVYAGDGMHLDGLLAAAAYRDLDDRTRRRMPPLSSEWVTDIALPLGRWLVDIGDTEIREERMLFKRRKRDRNAHLRQLWGWRASAEIAEWQQRGTAEVRKKPELDAMRRWTDAKSAQIGSGPQKAYDLALPTVFAQRIQWYGVGDMKRVLHLLRSHVPAIGRKKGLGWGTVGAWSIDNVDDDRSIEHEGKLMRRMPVQCGLRGRSSWAAIRPPYHHRSRVVNAVEPC